LFVLLSPGYLQKILKNHTAHACDGEQLTVICPHRTTISVLSAFYGRRVPSQNLCPAPGDLSLESTDCVSSTARQKMVDECQDQRWCHFSVHSHVFGPDPCPGTRKYLVVSYKCRPANHRLKTVCENEKLRLQCRNKSVLAIYSAIYGRPLRGKPECDAVNGTGPDIVPRQLLEQVSHNSSEDPFSISDYTHVFALSVALALCRRSGESWFLLPCGVSVGLVFLLLLFTPKMAFVQDFKDAFKSTKRSDSLELEQTKLRDDPEEENPDDSSSDSSFRHLTRNYRKSDNIFGPELTAALEGVVDQRGHEGDEIWIPKESSPYAIHKIKSATK
ncbi:hypothetical protein lerEdw1_010398, partial [Lerista edwardsae]